MLNELRELITRHCATVARKTEALSSILDGLNHCTANSAETVESAIALTHEIRGSAGSIGFSDIYSATTALENQLKSVRGAPEKPPQSVLEEILCHLEILVETTKQLKPESSHLFYAEISAMTRR